MISCCYSTGRKFLSVKIERYSFLSLFFFLEVAVWLLAGMRGGLVLASNNGAYSAMEPSDHAEAHFIEKDPTGRYIRVNNANVYVLLSDLALSYIVLCGTRIQVFSGLHNH